MPPIIKIRNGSDFVRVEEEEGERNNKSKKCKSRDWKPFSFFLNRYQFFLQIKKDVLQGRLPVSTELAAELAALALQCKHVICIPGKKCV